MGLKALAIYRDGSKLSQPLSTQTEGAKDEEEEPATRPQRERLSDTRQSITHKLSVAGHEGYITVGLFDDGRPGELFITMAKEGSTIGGLMDSFGTAVSMSLQYGVPLEVLVSKFSHTRFEPQGHTTNKDIRIAKSVVDYIFRWLGINFLTGYREATNGLPSTESEPRREAASSAEAQVAKVASEAIKEKADPDIDTDLLERAGAALKVQSNGESLTNYTSQFARFQTDAPSCDNCGSITVRNGNCYLCHNCGNSMGCS